MAVSTIRRGKRVAFRVEIANNASITRGMIFRISPAAAVVAPTAQPAAIMIGM